LSYEVSIKATQPPPSSMPKQEGNLSDGESIFAVKPQANQSTASSTPQQQGNVSGEESGQAAQPRTQSAQLKVHPKTNSMPRASPARTPRSLSRQSMSRAELLDPLRTATLAHCDEEVSRAKQAIEIQHLLERTPGLPGRYWASENPNFSREEEFFLVWAKLKEAVENKDASNIRRWVYHAENIGIEDSFLELERAYGERLARTSRGAWASAQRVVNAIDRQEFSDAAQLFVEACVTRGAQRSGILESLLQHPAVHQARNFHSI